MDYTESCLYEKDQSFKDILSNYDIIAIQITDETNIT